MKLLMMTPGRLPLPAVHGGAVETLINLLLDYNETHAHHEISVVAVGNQLAKEQSRKYRYSQFLYVPQNNTVSKISEKHLVPYRLLDWYFSKKAVRILKKKSEVFDCIVIQNEYMNGIVMRNTFENSYVYHAHNDIGKKVSLKEKKFLMSCNKVIGISDYVAGRFAKTMGLSNTVTVYNGIDTELFCCEKYREEKKRLRTRLGIPEEETIVVFAGRIVPEKGIEELLQAFMKLPDTAGVTLLVIGASFFGKDTENSFLKSLKDMCEAKKDKIIFTGYVDHSEMPLYYSIADIGCVPSIWEEPFGLTVAEQMAMELPVITTDSGAIPEIADHTCGIVLERNQNLSENIAAAIVNLSKNEKLRAQMGKNGRKIVCNQFSKETFCEKWFKIIEELEIGDHVK
ncbi:MAG: glycosyltransferase family 4 protein [Lachnospiraceae bacterium]